MSLCEDEEAGQSLCLDYVLMVLKSVAGIFILCRLKRLTNTCDIFYSMWMDNASINCIELSPRLCFTVRHQKGGWYSKYSQVFVY